jgi:hypothetical protein
LDSSGRSRCWDIRAPNALTTERQQLTATEVLRLIRGLPQQRPSQTSLARRYNVEFRTIEIDGPHGYYVVLRADPRRFAFYLWHGYYGGLRFSPYEPAGQAVAPFSASPESILQITEESHPGLPRLEWKYLHTLVGSISFYIIEVLDTAV